MTSSGPMQLGGIILLAMSLLPGLPTVPFLALGVGLIFTSRRLSQPKTTDAGAAKPGLAGPSAPKPQVEVSAEDFLQSDRISLEIGARLIPMVEPAKGSGLVDRISGLRRDLARQSGLWMPAVRIRDNMRLEPDFYRIQISSREVARGKLRPDQWLAINPGTAAITLSGEPTREPAFGLPAQWIPETDRQRAEIGGYTVVDAYTVLITHLGEVVRRHAHELLSREDLKALVDKVRESSPAIVDELIPNILTTGTLHRVLILLLEERLPISNLTRILESLANHAPTIKDVLDLTERVRMDIGRSICDRFRDDQGRLRVIALDPRLELEMRRGIQEKQLAFDPAKLEQLILRLSAEIRKATARGNETALLCDTSIRRPLRQALVRSLPDLSAIAYQEVPTDLLIEPAAFIRLEDLAANTPVGKAA